MPIGLLRHTLNSRRRQELATVREDVRGVEGWLTDAEGMLLHELARSCTGRGAIVEVGSWKGRSTVWLARGSRAGAGARVFAVDPHTGSEEHHLEFGEVNTLSEFRHNISQAGAASFVEAIVATSEVASAEFSGAVELAFIDGAHDYESVRSDINAWFPKLVIGGVVAFHDTISQWPDVMRAIRMELVDPGLVDRVQFVHSILYARKREHPSRVARLAGRTVLTYKDGIDAARPAAERLARRLRPR